MCLSSQIHLFLYMAFTHPWFLLGLLGIAIPIAIHLFELRKTQRILFSNVEFIKEVKLVTARQRKLRHWLVLLCRVSLVTCLALLFAQPFIPAPEAESMLGSTVGVLLDNSPSMLQVADNDQSLLERGAEQASELSLVFPQTARFVLRPGKTEAVSAAAYRSAVDQVQISGQSTPVGKLLAQEQAAVGKGVTFVISDFQRNSFSAQSIEKIPSTEDVFLIPLHGKKQANVFVDSVWLDDAFVRTGVDLQLYVRLKNGGEQVAEGRQVKLFVGAQQAATFQVTVPAGEAIVTKARVRLQNPGVQLARIEVEDFPIEFDNQYYFTLQAANRIRILELSAENELGRLYGNEPLFSYQHATAGLADYRIIEGANLLVVREAAVLSGSIRESIRRAVQQGATLVVVPAVAAIGRDSYSRLFRELGVGPVQWQPIPPAGPVLQEIAVPSTSNPFFRDVFSGINMRAGMPKAAPVLRWARSGSDVLQMRDGENFLSGFASGAGMVYVFAAPFTAPYSDFAQHPLFVPVLYRLAMMSYQQEQQPAYRLTQPTIRLRLPQQPQGAEAAYQLIQDSLRYIPGQQKQGNTLRLDIPPTMQQAGYYTLQLDGKPVTTLAFNFDKRESDLRSYAGAELRQLIGPNRPNIQVYEPSQGQTVAARYKATRVGTPLWRYFVWGALGCLLLEGLLLRWYQRPKPVQLAAAA
ncbi:BatA domain-containing protein [Hymenobacter metallilatus]|uniref:BatA domain-containing protein n=1 Tax=Hymenobacter metallilatus TaxID=2493666 RepID=UPI00163A9E91|nr:BatA domain-containing protein [Hymenobacter metallilatus]